MTTEEPKTIHQRLSEIQRQLKVPKSEYNSFGKFSFRKCEQILENVKPLLCDGESITMTDELVNIGSRYYVKATASLSCSGATISVVSYAREAENKTGMDLAQLTGACSSYARKYALSGLFSIDETEDIDSMDNTKHGQMPPVRKEHKKAKDISFSIEDRVTIDQVKYIYAMMKKYNWDINTVVSVLNKSLNISSLNDMNKKTFQWLHDMVVGKDGSLSRTTFDDFKVKYCSSSN